MAYLVLIRHGQSVWNAQDLWTGWTDVDLSKKGRDEADEAAEKIQDIKFDIAYCSVLRRAVQTWDVIRYRLGLESIPTISDKALDERNYGDLTGQNKWKIKEQYGEEQFLKWRRGWNEPIPGGETLKDVYERVVPYYITHILTELRHGKNVLVSAHGNSLRALIKFLDNMSDNDVTNLEIPTGQVIVYQINSKGDVINKEVRNAKTSES